VRPKTVGGRTGPSIPSRLRDQPHCPLPRIASYSGRGGPIRKGDGELWEMRLFLMSPRWLFRFQDTLKYPSQLRPHVVVRSEPQSPLGTLHPTRPWFAGEGHLKFGNQFKQGKSVHASMLEGDECRVHGFPRDAFDGGRLTASERTAILHLDLAGTGRLPSYLVGGRRPVSRISMRSGQSAQSGRRRRLAPVF
jgi:hypothetical protein